MISREATHTWYKGSTVSLQWKVMPFSVSRDIYLEKKFGAEILICFASS